MNLDSEECPGCSMEMGEIEIPRSRHHHVDITVDIGKIVSIPPSQPISIPISGKEILNPNEIGDYCVNPACKEYQDNVEDILNDINRNLEDIDRTDNWTEISQENIKYLSQLSESALDMADEREIEWSDPGAQENWKRIEDKIDDVGQNFADALESTTSPENDRVPGLQGLTNISKCYSSLRNLSELEKEINESEMDVSEKEISNENEGDEKKEWKEQIEELKDEVDGLKEEEQGPVERIEAEIDELKEEKEERIEERKAERETRIGELKVEVDELKEEQQEKIKELKDEKESRISERKEGIDELKAGIKELKDEKQERIEAREAEIEGLSEGSEEQIEELQEQIREIRKQKEEQIDTRRERIEERREENNERITEIRDEYDEQITGIRDEYENRIDTRRDRLTELEQGEDNTIEASTERDAATPEREHDESEAETTTAVANGEAGNGAASQSGKSEQDGESKQTTESSPGRTSGFDPNRTLSQEEIRELELNSDWSQYNQPRNGSYPTDDPDQTNDTNEPTREESSHEENPEKGDEERGGLV